MKITTSAAYALRAALYLASRPGETVSFREIASAQSLRAHSLARPLRWLADRGILIAYPGYRGGYRLRRDPGRVTVREVLEAVEGPIIESSCLLHGEPCAPRPDHWCPLHEVWETARRGFLDALERYNLRDLASRVRRWDAVETLLQDIQGRKIA